MDPLLHIMSRLLDLGYLSLGSPTSKESAIDQLEAEAELAEQRGNLEDEAYDRWQDAQLEKEEIK